MLLPLVVLALGCEPAIDAVLPPLGDPELAGSRYAAAVQSTPGLAAYFRFSEPSGDSARDRVRGYSLALAPGAALGGSGAVAGDPEPGHISFSAVSGARASTPLPLDLALGAELTLEIWLQQRGTWDPDQGQCLQRWRPSKLLWVEGNAAPAAWGLTIAGDGSRAIGLQLQIDTGRDPLSEVVASSANGVLTPAEQMDCGDGPWQHVVATFDGNVDAGQVKLYVDGQLTPGNGAGHPVTIDAEGPITIGGYDESAHLSVGGSGELIDDGVSHAGDPVDGSLDELAIYSRALDAAEVYEHFAAARR